MRNHARPRISFSVLFTACTIALLLPSAVHATVTVSYGDLGPNNSFITAGNTTDAGWCVTGPNTPNCGPEVSRAIAVPFTPAGTFLLTQLELPLNYFSGANTGTVQIVNTANGGLVPGTTVLASFTVSHLPQYPSATLTTLMAHPVFLYGGVQYWLVVSATNDTLLWWWGNVFGLSGPENELAGLWSPATGTLPAFAVIGTAGVPDPNASGCSGTNPQICWPSPQQNPNGFKYGYNLIDSGNSDIFIPLIDPNATYTFDISDATGSVQIGYDVTTNKTVFNDQQGAPAFAFDISQNKKVLWPSGSVQASESGFTNPVALLQIHENGDTQISLQIQTPDAPTAGPILVDGSLLDPPLPGRPVSVSGFGAIQAGSAQAGFAFEANRSSSGAVTGKLVYANPARGDFLIAKINSFIWAGNSATLAATCTSKKPCNVSFTVTEDTFSISGTGVTTESGRLEFGNIEIDPSRAHDGLVDDRDDRDGLPD